MLALTCEGREVSGGEEGERGGKRREAYVCWDEVAADCRTRGRSDTADAFRYGWEHSHALFQTGR